MNNFFLVLTKKKKFFFTGEKKIYFSNYYCGYDYDFKGTGDVLIEENMDFDFMPDVMRLVGKLSPTLSDTLNEVHGINFSHTFWNKILCYWWLPAFLRNVYLKYHKIKYLFEKYKYEKIRVALLKRDEWVWMTDVSDYILSSWEEKYNLQLWTKVVEELSSINPRLEKEYVTYGEEPVDGSTRIKAKEGLKRDPLSTNSELFLERLLSRAKKNEPLDSIANLNAIANFVGRNIAEKINDPTDAKCYMFCSGFKDDLFDKIIASTKGKARSIPNEIISRQYRKARRIVDSKKRDLISEEVLENLKECTEDEKTIIRVVLDETPMCFLELFDDIRAQYSGYLVPNVKYLISQHGAYNNTAFLFYAAEMHEMFQTELRGIQHGGNYQIEEFYWGDFRLSDTMYCWGKSDMDDKFVASVPYKLNQYPKVSFNSLTIGCNYIFFVDDGLHPYLVQTESVLHTPRRIENLLAFLETVNDIVKGKIRLRKYVDEYGWDIDKIVNNHIRGIVFDSFDDNLSCKEFDFPIKLKNSCMCVFNSLGTGWLEALAINKPFIAFFNEHMLPLRESEKPYMEMLYDAQILHHTGESAGRLLNEIYQDVEGWWNEPQRQKVVKTIRERYWNDFGDPNEWWVKEIQRLIKA